MPIAIVLQSLNTQLVAQNEPGPIAKAAGELIVSIDDGRWLRISFGLVQGEQMSFAWSDDQVVPFEDHVVLTLKQENNYSDRMDILGTVKVLATEAGAGERKFRFEEKGAQVVLRYSVKEID